MSGYSTTPNFALKKPITGADDDMWGTHWNQNADALDNTLQSHANSLSSLANVPYQPSRTAAIGAGEPNGVIIPMYFYPNDPFTDPTFLRLLAAIRNNHQIPTTVIVNAGSPGGPGTVFDAVWGYAITRLKSAGARVLAYVDTNYGDRPSATVLADIDNWVRLYGAQSADDWSDNSSALQGVFFDEFAYNTTNTAGADNIALYQSYYAHCYSKGFTYVVGNTGGDEQPIWYRTTPRAADMIVMWENSTWPTTSQLEGFAPDGHSYLTWRWNGLMIHSATSLDVTNLALARKHCKWIYVTDGVFSGGASNPWGVLSAYLEALYAALAGTSSGGSAGVSSFNSRTGVVTLSNADVITALPGSATPPVMDGAAAVGSGTTWARSDHIHPTDTSRYAASNPSGYQTAAQVAAMSQGFNYTDNAGFSVNQRGYVSGTALAAGIYGHDRWKAGAGGCTYTFAASPPSTTITITAGTLQQVIEGASVAGGNYMLSWAGTAQGRVGAGSYAASPVALTGIAAGASTTIEFNTGTLGRVKLEPGTVVTPWIAAIARYDLSNCQRFCQTYTVLISMSYAPAAAYAIYTDFILSVPMRGAPTVNFANVSYLNGATLTLNGAVSSHVKTSFIAAGAGQAYAIFDILASSDL